MMHDEILDAGYLFLRSFFPRPLPVLVRFPYVALTSSYPSTSLIPRCENFLN